MTSETVEVARIALRLPPFLEINVRLWIAQCDHAFILSGIQRFLPKAAEQHYLLSEFLKGSKGKKDSKALNWSSEAITAFQRSVKQALADAALLAFSSFTFCPACSSGGAPLITARRCLALELPAILTTDGGRQFESSLLKALGKLLGVQKCRTTGYHSPANGMIEELHRPLKVQSNAMLLSVGQKCSLSSY
ncbi:hypothetical protein TNCV_3904201 [Trichonephila clavipes]|nr:hypothetical protein TNCV_3904201 [Trichonephila clavipes]